MDSSSLRLRSAGLLLLLGLAVVAAERAQSSIGATRAARLAAPFHRDLVTDREEIDRDLAHSPNPAALMIERARIQGELRDWDGALADLDRALEIGADPYDVECTRAETFLRMGVPDRGERAATVALEGRLEGHRALVLRGEARMQSGRYLAAADDFGAALGTVERRPLDLVCAHAEALALGEDGARAALRALKEEISTRGPLPSLVLTAVEYERQLGDHGAALVLLDRLRDAGWSAVQYGLLLGDVLLEAGDRAGARAAWQGGLRALDDLPIRRQTTRASIRTRRDLSVRLEGFSR